MWETCPLSMHRRCQLVAHTSSLLLMYVRVVLSSEAREVSLLHEHAKESARAAASSSHLMLHIAGNALALKPHLTYLMGSAPEAHVHIGGADVALHHAQISQETLRPLQVDMPTLLNGRRMEAGQSAPLRQGDVIQLGSHLISVGTAPQQEASAAVQRHEQSTAIPVVQTQQAGNINPHEMPMKHGSAGYGGVYGQGFSDPEMDKMSHTLPGTHGAGVVHEQRSLAPGETKTLPDGTSVHNGAQPTIVEQVRHVQPSQQLPQQHTQAAVTGPALARLSAHQKPEYQHHQQQQQQQPHHEQMTVAHQPMTFATSSSGITDSKPAVTHTSSAAPIAAAAVAVPIAAAVTHTSTSSNSNAVPVQQQQQVPQVQQQQHLGSSKAPAFTNAETLVSSVAIPSGTTTHHVTSGTAHVPSSSSSTVGTSASTATTSGATAPFVLAPAFSTSELSSILSDMLDLSGSSMSPATRAALPSLFNLFAPQERQGMNSGSIKKWLHAAQEERKARMQGTAGVGAAAGNNTNSSNTATLAGSSSTSSHSSLPVDAALAARSLGASTTTDPKEITQSDLIFAILAMQAQEEVNMGTHQLGGGLGSSELGAAKLAAPAPISMSTGASSSASSGGSHTDFALLTLLSDLCEMGGWRLSSGWESAVRYMLDEHHLSRSRRSKLGNSAQLKNWLRAAAADRDATLNGQPQQPVVGAPANGDISPLNLARALITQQHQYQPL